jgi:hypothetical protein
MMAGPSPFQTPLHCCCCCCPRQCWLLVRRRRPEPPCCQPAHPALCLCHQLCCRPYQHLQRQYVRPPCLPWRACSGGLCRPYAAWLLAAGWLQALLLLEAPSQPSPLPALRWSLLQLPQPSHSQLLLDRRHPAVRHRPALLAAVAAEVAAAAAAVGAALHQEGLQRPWAPPSPRPGRATPYLPAATAVQWV